MAGSEIVRIEVNIKEAKIALDSIKDEFRSLKALIKEISISISMAFIPMQKCFEKTKESIYIMTDALSDATLAFRYFTQLLTESQETNQWEQEITDVFNTVCGVLSTIAGVAGALFAAGLSASTVGIVAIVMAAIAMIIAAIVEIIKHWDTIQAALAQGFSDFTNGAEGAWQSLYNIIQPVIDFFRATIDDLWEKHLKPFWENLCQACKSIGEGITTIWNEILMPVINWIIDIFAPAIVSIIDVVIGAVSVVVGFIADVVGGIFEVVGGLIKFIAGVFTGDWEKAWEGIVEIFKGVFDGIAGIVKGVFNGIIWAVNILIAAIYSAIAGVLNGIGGVAQFIGNIFGQDWSFRVPSNPPQIPYLAKGAVLPANRPFLAVVGDQRHGTNVEAPLATIQEAVALVLEDHSGAIGRKIKDSLKLRSGWGLAASKCPGSQEERSG